MCLLYFCLQITELLDDEKCEAECEELPQDGEEGPASSDSPQHTHTDDSPTDRCVSGFYYWMRRFIRFVFLGSCQNEDVVLSNGMKSGRSPKLDFFYFLFF